MRGHLGGNEDLPDLFQGPMSKEMSSESKKRGHGSTEAGTEHIRMYNQVVHISELTDYHLDPGLSKKVKTNGMC